MNWKLWIVALAALSLGATAAEAKKHRHRIPPSAQAEAYWPYSSRDDGPAHFVRLPNGLVVSSYQCFTDEGYGRYLPCVVGGKR